MRLAINSLYAEPGTSFELSYKVVLYIRQVLDAQIMQPYGLDRIEDTDLHLLITTKKDCQKVEAKGPDLDRKNKCRTWGLWLPYYAIAQSPNSLEAFIDRLFEAIGLVLTAYRVKPEDLNQAKSEVKKEVLGNINYLIFQPGSHDRIPLGLH